MSRFTPESWQEAALRPVAMTSPEAWVYVEYPAPDFRFILALLLLVACLLLRRRIPPGFRPVLAVALFVILGFTAWLATSGNGRYFLPVLLLSGPLVAGLVHWLPATRSLRFTALAAMVMWQGFLLLQLNPWGIWTYVPWRASPFELEVPPEWQREPATYVTVSTLSYAAIAPRFHPDSRWINVSELAGTGSLKPAARQARAFLAKGDPFRVIFPTLAPVAPDAPRVDAALADTIDQLLARQQLSLASRADCRLLPSTLPRRQRVEGADAAQPEGLTGFWACPLAREARPTGNNGAPAAPQPVDLVFQRLERACPRVFPAGYPNLPLPGGTLRNYTTTDTKVYVFDDGEVLSKYSRSINPERIGSVADVLRDGFGMDCGRVRRRAAVPWQRDP